MSAGDKFGDFIRDYVAAKDAAIRERIDAEVQRELTEDGESS